MTSLVFLTCDLSFPGNPPCGLRTAPSNDEKPLPKQSTPKPPQGGSRYPPKGGLEYWGHIPHAPCQRALPFGLPLLARSSELIPKICAWMSIFYPHQGRSS